MSTTPSAESRDDAMVQVSVADHIARVELDRPPVNALNRAMVARLRDVAEELGARTDVWLVVVTSRTNVFCAGADLKERAQIPDAQVLDVVQGIQGIARAWGDLPQPVVMGIQGAALGGGLEFALAGDLLIASEDAVLGLPEVSLGIIPAAGGTQRLAYRSSLGVARKWTLTARSFSAGEAFADGVVDFVFANAKFTSSLEEIIRALSANAPLALRQAKQALAFVTRERVETGFRAELDAYLPLVRTQDRKEALTAFAAKRQPKWTGE